MSQIIVIEFQGFCWTQTHDLWPETHQKVLAIVEMVKHGVKVSYNCTFWHIRLQVKVRSV